MSTRRGSPVAPAGSAPDISLAGLAALAVIVVREAELPAGADEAIAEAAGHALLAGSGTREAAHRLVAARQVWLAERSSVGPAALAVALAPALSAVRTVLLPASPDGRDLAPRLAFALGRPLLAGAVRCSDGIVELARLDDRLSVRVAADGPVVVTLRTGVIGSPPPAVLESMTELPLPAPLLPAGTDAAAEMVLAPEPATADLAEASRIVAGGAGVVAANADGGAVMALLADVAAALGASAGATRVVTDAGWMGYDRQIGTTGVAVSPGLYIAFGISGAAQHVGGLGTPDHVVSVNTDPSCPMTAMADLGIVADAPAVLAVLAERLGVPNSDRAMPRAEMKGAGHA